MATYTFPEDFWWGAATSGPQSEGRFHKKHANMFDYWYEIEPEAFYNKLVQTQHQTSIIVTKKTLL